MVRCIWISKVDKYLITRYSKRGNKMLLNQPFLFISAILFLLGIIMISYKWWLAYLLITLFPFLIFSRKNQNFHFLLSIILTFLCCLFLFQIVNIKLMDLDISREVRILLNRLSLFIFIFGLYILHLFHKKKISFFQNKPNWNNQIKLPFHTIKLLKFFIIGLLLTTVIFTPFIAQQGTSYIKSILLFCILFSLINSICEELLWRGILLSTLSKLTTDRYAIGLTSLGFGLLHLSIGIPFSISLLFSIGGVVYALIVLKTNSIYPAILLHFLMNIGMVLSGWIL